jgi:hypothetical protein
MQPTGVERGVPAAGGRIGLKQRSRAAGEWRLGGGTGRARSRQLGNGERGWASRQRVAAGRQGSNVWSGLVWSGQRRRRREQRDSQAEPVEDMSWAGWARGGETRDRSSAPSRATDGVPCMDRPQQQSQGRGGRTIGRAATQQSSGQPVVWTCVRRPGWRGAVE